MIAAAVRKKPKVWMNVTTSSNWNRPVVGIVRVERELCRELKFLYPAEDFGLCVFDGDAFIPYTTSMRLGERTEPQALLWPDRSRRFLRSSSFDPVLGIARWGSEARVDDQTVTLFPEASSPTKFGQGIAPGDIILSVGLDWDHPYVDNFQHLSDAMGVKIVTCCYDLIPILLPQYCVDHVAVKFSDYFTKISWASAMILCISKRSRDDYVDLVRRIGAPEAETIVIPLGDNVPEEGTPAGSDLAVGDLSPDVLRVAEQTFILFVSTIERRKNHEVLYRAYHLLAQEGHADRLPKLLFVGMPGWGVGELLMDIELDPLTKGLIVQLNHVSDRDLGYLYKKAYFCVFPSLYEGWGLPVGEALACGKAVIASGQGSIREVGGELVTYLDPWNPQAWADEILALTNQPERVKSMEDAVRRDYRVRTWRDTALVVKVALDRLREPTNLAITLYPGYDLQSMTGMACGEAIRSTGATGPLTYGPFRTLPAGAYDIKIAVDKLKGSSGTLLCVLRSAQGAKEHGLLEIDFDEREHCNVVATMERVLLDAHIDDYEICCEVSEDLLLSINKIDIKKVAG